MRRGQLAEEQVDSPLNHLHEWADLREDAARFGLGLKAVERERRNYPCLVVSGAEPIPIDVTSDDPRPWVQSARGSVQRALDRTLSSIAGRALLRLSRTAYSIAAGIDEVPPSRAVDFFRSNLERSLEKRLTAESRSANGDGKVMFEVHTITPHLRIHFAGAYFIRPEAAFGELSTPSVRPLSPGNYIFGAYDKALDCVRYQDAVYEVPDTTEAHLDF